MAIEFGTQLFASAGSLQPGQLIEFGYGGSARWGIVVAAAWKMNCDCYVFDSKEGVPEELLEWSATQRPFGAGDLYNQFGNQYTFKSFKLEKMTSIQNIEFDTYGETEASTEETKALTDDGTFWQAFGIENSEEG